MENTPPFRPGAQPPDDDTDRLHGLFDHLRVGIQFDTQPFQHIGTAAFGGNAAIAMLGNGNPATGHATGRRGRDVKGLEPVSAGAAGIHHR